jgi:hypothetical protein
MTCSLHPPRQPIQLELKPARHRPSAVHAAGDEGDNLGLLNKAVLRAV